MLAYLSCRQGKHFSVGTLLMLIRVSALLGVALGMVPTTVGAQAHPFGSGEASAAGQAVLAAQIARYGRITNPAWDQVILSVLSRLQRATGYPGLRVSYVVVGNAEARDQANSGIA